MTALELLRSRADQYETLAEWHAERAPLEPSISRVSHCVTG
jgi:hypothetical protein